MSRDLLIALLSFIVLLVKAQDQFTLVKKNLSSDWEVFANSEYNPWRGDMNATTIYVPVALQRFDGDIIEIESRDEFRIFVNGQLQPTKQKRIRYPVDSLHKYYEEVQFAIHFNRSEGVNTLTTRIISSASRALGESAAVPRSSDFMRDFVITVLLFLLLSLIAITRFNPRLALDYFSARRLLSIRESDDSQSHTGLIGINILFILYASLSLGLLFIIISQFDPPYSILQELLPESFAHAILIWLKISGMVVALLIAKAFVIYGISYLFGISESVDVHLLNTLRVFLQAAFLLTILASVYFIVRGQTIHVYIFLYRTLGVILFGWIVLMYFKMSIRTACSPFHLFSYICATEIVTLIVLSKVLYQ